jgi:hypothetical protein
LGISRSFFIWELKIMKEESLGAQILKRGLFELKIMENGSLGPQNLQKWVFESSKA